MKQQPLLYRPLDIGAIVGAGAEQHVEASDAERAAIAAEHKLIAVEGLSADLDVGRTGDGLITIDGRLRAEVVQTCVISLEPAPQSIDEVFHVTLASAGSDVAPPEPKPGAEVMVDPEIDQPDVVHGPTIDLGAIVLEHFVLALDPYPRAPSARLPVDVATDGDESARSPFAVLAGLKSPKS
ncbi:MAG: DUF177 domain-containing protein [Bauldia sp.]|nr:DUF177 domain-containing protein [Bauldia sp.]